MKKQVISSVLSYVFLALGVFLFVYLGFYETGKEVVMHYYGCTIKGFNFAWDILALLDGSMATISPEVAGISYAAFIIWLGGMGFLAAKKHKYSTAAAAVTFVQMLVCFVATLFVTFAFRRIGYASWTDMASPTEMMLFVLMCVFILVYGLLQVFNYMCVLFCHSKKEEAVAQVAEEGYNTAETPVENTEVVEETLVEETAPVEEEKTEEVVEETTPVEETVVEEAPVEEVVEDKPEEVVEEKVEETPAVVEEEKVEEPVEETPVEEENTEEVTPVSEETETAVAAEGTKAPSRRKITFEDRLNVADPELVKKYHEIRDEIMSYGIKSRVSSSGDTFRLHTIKYMKIIVAGKKLKLYMKLNPKDYDGTTIPHEDGTNKPNYYDIPMIFKVQSDLSLKRAKQLIKDMMDKEGFIKLTK